MGQTVLKIKRTIERIFIKSKKLGTLKEMA